MIKPGSKVVCVDNSNIRSNSGVTLSLGEVYTVSAIRELHRGIGISLEEKQELIRVIDRKTGRRWIDRQWFHINRFLDITEIEIENQDLHEQTTTI